MGGKRSKQKLTEFFAAIIFAITASTFLCGFAPDGGRRHPLVELPESISPQVMLELKNGVSGLLPSESALYETGESEIEFSLRTFGRPSSDSAKKNADAVEHAVFAADLGRAVACRSGGRISMELTAVYRKNGGILAADYRERTGELKMLHSIYQGKGAGKDSTYWSGTLGAPEKRGGKVAAEFAEYASGNLSSSGDGQVRGSIIAILPDGKGGGALMIRLDYAAKRDQHIGALARFVFASALGAAGYSADGLKAEYLQLETAQSLKITAETNAGAESANGSDAGGMEAEGDAPAGAEEVEESETASG